MQNLCDHSQQQEKWAKVQPVIVIGTKYIQYVKSNITESTLTMQTKAAKELTECKYWIKDHKTADLQPD